MSMIALSIFAHSACLDFTILADFKQFIMILIITSPIDIKRVTSDIVRKYWVIDMAWAHQCKISKLAKV